MTWFERLNQFSDLTHAEFKARYVGGKRRAGKAAAVSAARALPSAAAPPASVDWRAQGAVTPVKDQGQCGSCWAFATTVATEGATFVNSSKLISLSEEQIVSCDKADGNAGCNGGDQLPAMQWLKKTGGQCSEADYPYTSGGGKDGKCKTTCKPATVIYSAIEVPARDETALMTAIAGQPVSLSVDASGNGWQSYGGGVYSKACACTNENCLDHGVGGVGYGSDATAGDFWIVKNSWAASWGDKGCVNAAVVHFTLVFSHPIYLSHPFPNRYIMLGRGQKYGATGQCGVQVDNQYVTAAPTA